MLYQCDFIQIRILKNDNKRSLVENKEITYSFLDQCDFFKMNAQRQTYKIRSDWLPLT